MTYNELLNELSWQPIIENGQPPRTSRIIVGGMGGSALPPHAARFLEESLLISTHRDYDLPVDAPEDALYVAISFSGNTAETLSFARAALERGLPLAVIASGGELLDLAKEQHVPFVIVPSDGQPRNALFFLLRSLFALFAFLDKKELLTEFSSLSFDADDADRDAAKLIDTLANAMPVFYASRKNGFLTYVSKVHFNETAKMPAYANVFPELNHNEMQSFDTTAPEEVGDITRFVLLRDEHDDPRIAKRMDVLGQLLHERGRRVTQVPLMGENRVEKLVRTWYVMHLAARKLAEMRNVDPDTVPMVEDFKKRL